MIKLFLLISLICCFGSNLYSQTAPINCSATTSNEEVNQLIQTINNRELLKTDPAKVISAVDKLDRLKSAAAINNLIPLLTLEREREYDTDFVRHGGIISPFSVYPAMRALRDIGICSLPALLKVMADNKTDTPTYQNAFDIFLFFFQEDVAGGIGYLEKSERETKNRAEKSNFQATINKIRALQSRGQSIITANEIDKLRVIIRDKNLLQTDPVKVVKAIDQLRTLKAVEAVDELAQLLTLDRGPEALQSGGIHTEFSIYPAAGALYSMGEKSFPALIRVIKTEPEDSLASRNASATIAFLLPNFSKTAQFFENAANETKNPVEAKKLLKAAQKWNDLGKSIKTSN